MMNFLVLFCGFFLLLCRSTQTKPNLKRTFQDGDKRVFMFDELFPTKVIESFFSVVTFGKVTGKISSWFYTYSDYYQDFRALNTSSNSPWIALVDPDFFTSTALWNITSRRVIERVAGEKVYFPYDVSFSMHRRLDFITATSKGKKQIEQNDYIF